VANANRQGPSGYTAHIDTAAAFQAKVGSGVLNCVTCIAPGTSFALAIYDDSSANNNQIFSTPTAAAGATTNLDIPFQSGLRIVASGTPGRYCVSFD
jgi:hypothetical protein